MGGIISQEELESWMATQEHKARTALERRIEQLEKLNATLAAEVDRMRPVVEAVQRWRHGWEGRKPSAAYQINVATAKAVDAYEASTPK